MTTFYHAIYGKNEPPHINKPAFNRVNLYTNTTQSTSDIELNDSYLRYSLLEFVVDDNGTEYTFYTTPEFLDKCITLASSIFCLDRFNTNHYITYKIIDNTHFQYNNRRDLYLVEINGMECTNAIINKTLLYETATAGSGATSVTLADGSFFDYDLILFSTATGASGEAMPSNVYSNMDGLNKEYDYITVFKYNSGNATTMTETTLSQSSGSFFMIQGIKFT